MNVNGLLNGDQHAQDKPVDQINNNNNAMSAATYHPPSPPPTAHVSTDLAPPQLPSGLSDARVNGYPSPPLTHEGASAGSPSQPEVEPAAAPAQPLPADSVAPAASATEVPPVAPAPAQPEVPAKTQLPSSVPSESEVAPSADAAPPAQVAAPAAPQASTESAADGPASVLAAVASQPGLTDELPSVNGSAPAAAPSEIPATTESASLSSGQKRSASPPADADVPNKRMKSSTPPPPPPSESHAMAVDPPAESFASAQIQSQSSEAVEQAPAAPAGSEATPAAASMDLDADAPGSAELPSEVEPSDYTSAKPIPESSSQTSSAPPVESQGAAAAAQSLPPPAAEPTVEPVQHLEATHIGDTNAAAQTQQEAIQPSVDTTPFAPSFSSASPVAIAAAPVTTASTSPDVPVPYGQSPYGTEAPQPMSQEAQAATPSSAAEPFSQSSAAPPAAALDQQQDSASAALPYGETPFSQAAAAMQRGETLEFAPKPDTTWAKAEHPLSGVQFKFAQKLVKDLLKHKASGPFHMPVDPYSLNLPTYWAVIKNPIDFGSISTKLNNGAYGTLDEFAADVRRVFSNCYHFNGEAAPVSLMAKQVEPMFEAKIQKAPSANAPASSGSGTKQRKNSMPPLNSSVSRQSTGSERPKREVQPPTPYDPFEDNLQHQQAAQSKKKSSKPPPPAANMLPEELKFCKEMVRELFKKAYQPFAWPFLQPVDWQGLGLKDYPEIVPRPMDLGTMKQKLESGQYYDAEGFYRDFKLIISNCVKYNGSESDVGKMAAQLDQVFNSRWAEKPDLSDDDHSDDDEIRMMEQQLEMMRENLDRMKENKARKRAERLAAKSAAKAAERAAQAAAVRKAKPPPAPRPPPKQVRRPSPELDLAFEEEPDDDFDFDAELADTAAPEKPSGRGARRKSHKKRRDSDEDDDFLGASVGGNKAADDHSRSEEITFEMKQELANGIGALDAEKLDKAIDIIRKSRPDLLGDESKEIELDIDSLDNSTLYKLYTFVVRGGNKNKPKRQETLTARGQRAQKGGRAGTGGLKGKSLDEAAESAKIAALEAQLAAFNAENGGNADASAASVAAAVSAAHGDDEEESESEDDGGASSGSE